jgi:polar amino acid transport system substrate-binding protein
VFATDPWPPFFVKTPGDEDCVCSGTAVHLINRIFAQIDGYSPKFPYTPWKRGLLDMQSGRKDALPFVLKKPGREEYMHFTKPIFEINSVLFTTRSKFEDGFEWNNTDDLIELRLGVVAGYTYGSEFDAFIQSGKVKVSDVRESVQGMEMLALGRIDALIENEVVGLEIIKTRFPEHSFHISEKPVNQDILYIGVSKKSPHAHVIRDINLALDRLHATGVVTTILSGAGKLANSQ